MVSELSPGEQRVRIHEEATYQLTPEGFSVEHHYTLLLENTDSGKTCCGQIEARFVLQFASEIQMDEHLFTIFKDINLMMNTWPYWREFVQSGAARMGWPTLTLPLRKRGERVSPPKPEPSRPKTPKAAGKTPKAKRSEP